LEDVGGSQGFFEVPSGRGELFEEEPSDGSRQGATGERRCVQDALVPPEEVGGGGFHQVPVGVEEEDVVGVGVIGFGAGKDVKEFGGGFEVGERFGMGESEMMGGVESPGRGRLGGEGRCGMGGDHQGGWAGVPG
jgi:hypothetical protein